MKRLVYYTEIGKTTNLPLPAEFTHKTTKEGQSGTTTTVSHEKTSSIAMDNTVSNGMATGLTTISNVQATINGSNEHKLKITSPGKGGYGIESITINNTTYGYTAIKNQYLTGTSSGDLDNMLMNIDGSIILSLIHISEPTRLGMISYAVFCLKKKKTKLQIGC